jgi:uncharacterized phage protein (TIGR01671 family)
MRAIKFRGKSTTHKIWFYGDLVHCSDDTYSICGGTCGWSRVDTNTIGQFTGLCDDNGKEIYEGDIIQIPELSVLRLSVEYNQKLGMFTFVEYSYTEGIIKGATAIGEMIQRYPQMRVIGNIHDNPELIK